jgi:hypothetical protein
MDGYSYKIFSISGLLVGEGLLEIKNSRGSIALPYNLSSGVYIIQLKGDYSNQQLTSKLIIK